MPNQRVREQIVVKTLPMEIERGGEYSIAQSNPNTYTHIYFKYPCRFIPEIPRWGIKKYLDGDKSAVVFDPFSGSGTTLLEGIINGYDTYGTEIDNIAKLIIKVKTTLLTQKQLATVKNKYEKIIDSVSNENTKPTRPDINNLEHWFIDKNIEQLGKMLTTINEIKDNDIRDFFKVCFISIIKKVSNADDISPKPYVSSKIKKNPPLAVNEFASIFKRYFDAIESLSLEKIIKKANLTEGNALDLQFDKKINLAITSPPYINAFDYSRTLRLENLWLGILTEDELRDRKKDYVGTEKLKLSEEEKRLEILSESPLLKKYFDAIYPLDKKRAFIVKRFFDDMKINLSEIYNSLVNSGYYIVVIGNSNIRGVEIESWKVLEEISKLIGYETDTHFSYVIQNPYIRIPRGNKGGKINSDIVLVLKKAGM